MMPEPPPHLRWSASFSSAFIDGRSGRHPGAIVLHSPSGWTTLRDDTDDSLAGRYLREGERILTGVEMVIDDYVVAVGLRASPPRRRRLTLAPGDLIDLTAVPEPSGSCLGCLASAHDADEVQSDGEAAVEPLAADQVKADAVLAGGDGDEAAVRAANMVLAEASGDDGGGAWATVSRRKKSREELVQEFWNDVGFPTPASRIWERRGSASPESPSGQVRMDSFSTNPLSSDRRSPGDVVPSKALPAAVRQTGRGVHIHPWKGPLPRPRLVQPVALADFLPEHPPSSAATGAPSSVDHDPKIRMQLGADVPVMELHGVAQTCMAQTPLLVDRPMKRADMSGRPGAVRCWQQGKHNPSPRVQCLRIDPASPPRAPSFADAVRRPRLPQMSGGKPSTPSAPPPPGRAGVSHAAAPGGSVS